MRETILHPFYPYFGAVRLLIVERVQNNPHPFFTMTRKLLLLALASSIGVSTTLAGPVGGAGYNTARVGPDNANCQRQDYRVAVSSSNIEFKSVDSFAKMVRIINFPHLRASLAVDAGLLKHRNFRIS